MDEMPSRISNGSKAIHIATEHFARVEQELEEATARLEDREQKLATALGRIAEQSEMINRIEQERNSWMLKTTAMAQALLNASAVLVQGGREAQDIIGDVRHGQVAFRPAGYTSQAAEELQNNGSGG